MKSYPSIPRGVPAEFEAHVFDKIDGSNLRFEWSAKRGWYKSGTRTRLFDASDPVFGGCIQQFMDGLAEDLEAVARRKHWDRMVVFCEAHGESSFAGSHEPGEVLRVSLIDVAPHRKGILTPEEYLRLFGDLKHQAAFLGVHRWDADFVQSVRRGEMPGVTFEGVVGKASRRSSIIMAKAKTQAWIDRVMARFGDKGRTIAES